MEIENLRRQAEEVEALSAIYGSDWILESETCRTYSITIREKKNAVKLSVTMTDNYPTLSPPRYEISAPWMDRNDKVLLHKDLKKIYTINIGEPVIFQIIEKIREKLQATKAKSKNSEALPKVATLPKPAASLDTNAVNCPQIIHGAVILDRKSAFQGHAAKVHSLDEVKYLVLVASRSLQAVIIKLKTNKKIQNAKHNMYAYIIEQKTGKGTIKIVQDHDEDGEAHAGARMLHLLQMMKQKNVLVLVVVTRWYGGIQLGPDRFRHINNAARQALLEADMQTDKPKKRRAA